MVIHSETEQQLPEIRQTEAMAVRFFASKTSDFNGEGCMQCLDIFRGKGLRDLDTTSLFVHGEKPVYGGKGLVKDTIGIEK
jgi:hypothetical protein